MGGIYFSPSLFSLMTMVEVIIKWKPKHGKSRSEIERNLRKEGWGSSLTEAQIDKCAYLERQAKEEHGLTESSMRTKNIDKVKSDKK